MGERAGRKKGSQVERQATRQKGKQEGKKGGRKKGRGREEGNLSTYSTSLITHHSTSNSVIPITLGKGSKDSFTIRG